MGAEGTGGVDSDRGSSGLGCSELLELLRRGGGSVSHIDATAAKVIHDFHTMRSFIRGRGLWDEYLAEQGIR